MSVRHTVVDTTLGAITLVAEGERLTGLYFPHHWYKPDEASFGSRVDVAVDAVLDRAATQVEEYLRGERTDFDLPIELRGDSFEQRVWAQLQQIPYGSTTTYGEIATALGDPALAQTVGRAVGRNPLCVVVACHRVVGKGGRLTGYAGGLKRKAFLLDRESAVTGSTLTSAFATVPAAAR